MCATLALALLSACSSPPKGPPVVDEARNDEGSAGFGGQVVVTSTTTNATVIAVNPQNRTILLRFPSGDLTSYRAGSEIASFDSIKVGDQVRATTVEQFAVSMAPAGALSNPTNRTAIVRAMNGAQLSPTPATIVKVDATLLSFDYIQHLVTLKLGDGTIRTIHVREGINLGDYNVGDTVSVLTTEAMTIALEKQ